MALSCLLAAGRGGGHGGHVVPRLLLAVQHLFPYGEKGPKGWLRLAFFFLRFVFVFLFLYSYSCSK